jgi:predicted esterase YcpF (UPF0227 family)
VSKILYLHGFKSCGISTKSSLLKTYFGEHEVDSPDLPYAPQEAIVYLESLLQSGEYTLLMGSSLGGFYATYLAEKLALKAVLLNPSTKPWETLAPYVGWQERFCDGEFFEFKSIFLEQLKLLSRRPKRGTYLALLQSEDELLDYRVAKELYGEHRIVVEYGGNHRFENLEAYLSMIALFRGES